MMWALGDYSAVARLLETPAKRYADFRRDAKQLMEDLNTWRDGGVELNSSYVTVLARR